MNEEDFKNKFIYAVQQARTSLYAFCLLIYPPAVTSFIWSKLHIFLMNRVQAVYEGNARKRQTVSVPPQHGKSQVLSKIAVAWMMGARPGITIAITGFSHTLVTKFSKEVKQIVNSKMYQIIFPQAKSVYGSDKAEEWELSNGSCLIAKSAGSKLTGRRVDWLIIDDPHSGREEAESATMRRKIVTWYFGDCVTRLSPGAVVFIIATRWHPEDLIGYLTGDDYIQTVIDSGVTNVEDEIFEVTNIPALCETEEGDPLGRKVGEAAFPEVRHTEFLEKIKATIPAYEWRSQYQGDPQTSSSGQADVSKLNYCNIGDVPGPDMAIWTRGWDLAISEDQAGDYTVGALTAFEPEQKLFYIIEVFRKKQAWVKLKSSMFDVVEQDVQRGVHGEGIEAVAGFAVVFSEIKKKFLGQMNVKKRNPKKGGKLLRAQPWFNLVEASKVYLVRAPWNKDFVEELRTFPDSTNDDQIDAISVSYEMIPRRLRFSQKLISKEEPVEPGETNRRSRVVRPKQRTRVIDI